MYYTVKARVNMQNCFATRRGAAAKMVDKWKVVDEQGEVHWDMKSEELALAMASAMNSGDQAEITNISEICRHGRQLTPAERNALHHMAPPTSQTIKGDSR